MSRICRNPRCGDWTRGNRRLCQSCRFAMTLGAGGASVLLVLGDIAHEIDWLPLIKAVFGWVFQ